MLVGEQAGSLRNNSPGERMLLGYWCKLRSSAALGVGEVSRRAGSTSVEGVKEDRNPARSQNSGGRCGGGGGGLPQSGGVTPADFLSPLTSWRRKWITGAEVSIALFPTMKTEPGR